MNEIRKGQLSREPGAVYRNDDGRYEFSNFFAGINPPPEDLLCECCGVSANELATVGGCDDPLVGDLRDAILVKNFRRFGPYDPEADRYFHCAKREGIEVVRRRVARELGKEMAEKLYLSALAYDQIGASWECRDCLGLDNDEYHEAQCRRWESTSRSSPP